jgi:hypothetical protein
MATVKELNLVREAKIRDLLTRGQSSNRWEASGVLVKDGSFFVVFDDRTEVGKFSADLAPGKTNKLLGVSHGEFGYEGITYNAGKERFYLLIEACKQSRGCYQAVIVEYDDRFHYLKERPLEFEFKSDNKGFEAVAHVRRNDQDYVLALCEGNKCKCGSAGRKPGGGRVQLFEKRKRRWAHSGTIALPTTVHFVDYSGMSIDNGRVAIVSQVNSMLWIGQFDEASWEWCDAGELYEFPRSEEQAIQYGNIEGVGWMSPTRIVTVSDRRSRRNQPDKGLSEKDQSVHIFEIPS